MYYFAYVWSPIIVLFRILGVIFPILVTLLFDFETVYIGLCVHRLEDAYHAHRKASPMLQYGTGDGEFFFSFLPSSLLLAFCTFSIPFSSQEVCYFSGRGLNHVQFLPSGELYEWSRFGKGLMEGERKGWLVGGV